MFIFADRVPFSITFALGALALVFVTLPLGLGPVVMPLCLSYLVVFCGLSTLPGQSLLKNDVSYGVYLIHAPILTSFILLFPDFRIWWLTAMIVLLLTLVLSYLSWTLVEEPVLRQKQGVSNWLHARVNALCHLWGKDRCDRLAENK